VQVQHLATSSAETIIALNDVNALMNDPSVFERLLDIERPMVKHDRTKVFSCHPAVRTSAADPLTRSSRRQTWLPRRQLNAAATGRRVRAVAGLVSGSTEMVAFRWSAPNFAVRAAQKLGILCAANRAE